MLWTHTAIQESYVTLHLELGAGSLFLRLADFSMYLSVNEMILSVLIPMLTDLSTMIFPDISLTGICL